MTEYDKPQQILFAHNDYNNEFSHKVTYITANLELAGHSGSRHEFIGHNRTLASPYLLESKNTVSSWNLINSLSMRQTPIELSGKTGAGIDPCGTLKVTLVLQPGEKRHVLFCMGQENSFEEARSNACEYRQVQRYQEALNAQKTYWESIVSVIQVKTPNRSMDVMLNGWLIYQNLSCRINGRSGFYQSGGAYGFRDQLQDAMCLLYSTPEHTRKQILLNASRQFPEGDVQHWWHPPTGRGVRTRFTDDYLWLPYVVDRYIAVTGDFSILDEVVPYIEGHGLEHGQMEAYLVPEVSEQKGTVYEHCIRAIDRALQYGFHGLPLIGGGDWNDGMNEIGAGGKGESVWLGWFVSDILKKFIPVVTRRQDTDRAGRYEMHAQQILSAIEENAWDGKWYRRAFFDDGTPLGSKDNDECQIDSLPQTWSIITGGGEKARAHLAMDQVYEQLVDEKNCIIKLLTPPFDTGTLEPGYIKGYLPGTRENGGQYTHAAAWVIMATAMLGRGEKSVQLFDLVNPINHALDENGVATYKGEPYVTCGDVYSAPPHTGRAGWSWYTGSAGWLYRVGIENILGLQIHDNYFVIDPCIPSSWDEYSMKYRSGEVIYSISVKNPEHVETGVKELRVAGKLASDGIIPRLSEGNHRGQIVDVEVLLGKRDE